MQGNTRRRQLLEWFPNAGKSATALSITSPIDFGYNCVAWALDRTDRWWQPASRHFFWPIEETEASLDVYLRMFGSQGFERCESGELEAPFAKVAIYVDAQGNFLHVAKQLESGRWSSKCGGESDIAHSTAELLEGSAYGRLLGYMKRPKSAKG